MRALALGFALAVAGAGGCGDDGGDGGDSSGGGPDAATEQADAAAGGENALGRACDAERPCPSDPPHQCVFLDSGNPEVGYCSPVCTSDTDCLEGYDGQVSGEVRCFVPDLPQACSITCESPADCPGDTTCVSPGGPAMVCASQ